MLYTSLIFCALIHNGTIANIIKNIFFISQCLSYIYRLPPPTLAPPPVLPPKLPPLLEPELKLPLLLDDELLGLFMVELLLFELLLLGLLTLPLLFEEVLELGLTYSELERTWRLLFAGV